MTPHTIDKAVITYTVKRVKFSIECDHKTGDFCIRLGGELLFESTVDRLVDDLISDDRIAADIIRKHTGTTFFDAVDTINAAIPNKDS